MSYITSNQGRPIQGVSQQPEKTRLPGQCTLSENLRPDVVRGLINRQGTEIAAKLAGALPSNTTKWHHYDRGTGEEYLVSIDVTGKVKVWGLDGVQHIVNVQDNTETGYLAMSKPKDYIKCLTIGDYTFLVNTKKVVVATSDLTTAVSNTALINIQYMDYGQSLQVWIDDVMVAAYTSPRGDSADHAYLVKTTKVADDILSAMTGGSHGAASSVIEGTEHGWTGVDISADYTFTKRDNVIEIHKKDDADYKIKVLDGVAGANAVAIKGKIKDTTMLPGKAPEGFKVEVEPAGSSKNKNSNFWLEAVNTNSDHITWRESIAPGISKGMDKSSMPHVLVRESISDGVATFTLRQGEWADREVGSDNTNPLPTFIHDTVGTTIQSVGLFQNRLFFTSGESVVMTRSSDFFNFFRETAQANLDTDPIDVFADVPSVNFLRSSLYFDGDLVFFSEQGQFILDGSKPITRDNAVLRQATSYEAQLSVDPVASGDAIFFAFNYGRFTGIREFFTDSVTDTKMARPVTDHVKQYLKGDPKIMVTSTNLNLLLIKTDHSDNTLYSYDWLWQGADKVQSSWGEIKFPENDKILYMSFTEEILWLVMLRDGAAVYLEKVDMGDPPDEVLGFPIRLDRKKKDTMIQSTPGEWTCANPYPDVSLDDLVVVRKTGAFPADVGTPIDVYKVGANLQTIETLNDNASDVEVIIGVRYKCKYSPTNPVALDENGYALNLDRLTVGAFYMNYNTIGDIKATVTSDNGSVRVYEYNNRTLGGPENLVGFAPLVDGQHRVPIRQKSDKYTLTFSTNSHLPLEVRDFEYSGNMNRRGGRL